MKKNKLLMIPSALAIGAMAFALQGQVVKTSATGDFSNLPVAGEVSADSYFTNAWSATVGARRISDKGVLVVDSAGWGQRGKIPSRKFDLESFHFSIDLSNAPFRAAMMIMVGNTEGTYCNDAANMIAIDVVKHSTDPSIFMVTVDTAEKSHATSIDEWKDGKAWADDGAYQGRTITADDGVIDFTMTKVNNTISTIKCNDQEVTVTTSELYKRCAETTKGYVAIGNYGGSGEYSYIINDIGDATDKTYFSNSGAFGKVKSELSRLDTDYTSASIEDITNAKLAYDAMPYADLYRWDKSYFNASYASVGEKIDAAVKAAGNTIQIDLLSTKITALEGMAVTSEAEIDATITASREIETMIEEIGTLSLTPEETTTFEGLTTRYDTQKTKVATAAKAAYEAAVVALEGTVGTGITSGSTYVEYSRMKGSIPNKYAGYFTEGEFDALYQRLQAASEIAEGSVTIDHPNWKQGNGAKVITTSENTIDLVSSGSSLDCNGFEETSGLYLQEALNVLDFSVKFKASVPTVSGAWFTLGFMQNPDMWIHTNGDVTDNQGIYFLITRISGTQYQVETHLCSMASASFFDSTLSQMITIPSDEDITLSFSTETRTVAGVSDTYFNIKFNDIAIDQEAITTRKIKTVIPAVNGAQKGYFIAASSGYGASDPALIQIKDINGFSPLADTLAKAKTEHEAPTSSSSKVTFVHGSANGKANFNVDFHGEEFVSLKVDGNDATADSYTLTDTKITFNNAYCNSLSVGEHKITLTTTGGSIEWTLDVVDGGQSSETTSTADSTGEEPTKKGCGGSIAISSLIISFLTLGGIALVKARKEN